MGRNKKFTKKEEQQICKQYIKEKLSLSYLAKKWGCSESTIRDVIIRNGYILRTMSEAKKIFLKKQELQVCKWYVEDKLSCPEIAKKLKCCAMAIWHIINRNGYPLRTMSEAIKDLAVRRKMSKSHSTPKAIQQSLKNGFGIKCYYKGEFYPSLFEKDCVIRVKELGFEVEHNFLGRFDAKAKKGNFEVVMEFHMCNNKGKDRIGLTYKQYYNQRRKLLNEYGYKDLKLVVIKNLKEIENKLISK